MWTSLQCCVCGWTMTFDRYNAQSSAHTHISTTQRWDLHLFLCSLFTWCWQYSLNFTQDSISLAFQWAFVSFPESQHKYTQTCITTQQPGMKPSYFIVMYTTPLSAGSGVHFLLCDGPSILWWWYTDPERAFHEITHWTLCVAFHL